MILADCSTVETLADEVEDLGPRRVLTDMELRHELPTHPSSRMTLYSHVKRTLAVYEAGDVRIQPFLLIDRTRHIVTAHTVGP